MSKAIKIDLSNKPPRKKEKHLWADYIEVACLLSSNEEISVADISALINNNEGISPEEDVGCTRVELISEQGEAFNEDDLISPEILEFNNTDDGVVSENIDQIDDYSKGIFELLKDRSALYEEHYPFLIDGSAIVRKKECNKQSAPYIFMLICSNTRMIMGCGNQTGKSIASTYQSDFERYCCKFTQSILPTFNVYQFHKKFFDLTKLNKKLFKLAEVISERAKDHAIQDLSEGDTGDKGVDVIAHYNFKDSTSASAIILGQCATSPDMWKKKQKETDTIKGYIDLFVEPHYWCFIPFHFRKGKSTWEQVGEVKTVLLDRLRLLTQKPPAEYFEFSELQLIE